MTEENAAMKYYDGFPQPPGEYTVGRTQMDFDYTASNGKKRELTALFFYPSDCSEGKETAEYAFPELPGLLGEMKVYKSLSLPGDGFFPLDFKTWCYEDLALSEKEKRYPVLFYVHGGTTYPQVGTQVCEDLASLGYIVVAIGHQGTGAYKRKDGRIFDVSEEFMDTILAMNQDQDVLNYTYQIATGGRFPEEKAIETCRVLLKLPAFVALTENVMLQEEDVRYVADCLAKMNTGEMPSMFAGRLALELGIGAYGHSYGGPTVSMLLRDDARFVCAVGLDSAAYGVVDDDLAKPILLLCSETTYDMNAVIGENNSAETYYAIVPGVVHYDFSDWLFTNRIEMLKGTRDEMKMRDILTTYTSRFFDKYLLRKQVSIEEIHFEGVDQFKR